MHPCTHVQNTVGSITCGVQICTTSTGCPYDVFCCMNLSMNSKNNYNQSRTSQISLASANTVIRNLQDSLGGCLNATCFQHLLCHDLGSSPVAVIFGRQPKET
mmetsp:Transcript_81582/g.144069  ORF Transcript_81582/g.144069 Transcript_81582/m.144069 type:complete len:103 (+) Transcript_81582:111-419(+)